MHTRHDLQIVYAQVCVRVCAYQKAHVGSSGHAQLIEVATMHPSPTRHSLGGQSGFSVGPGQHELRVQVLRTDPRFDYFCGKHPTCCTIWWDIPPFLSCHFSYFGLCCLSW